MKVRRKGTFEAVQLPKCNDAEISEKWLVIDGAGDREYLTQSEFDRDYEPARKKRERREDNAE